MAKLGSSPMPSTPDSSARRILCPAGGASWLVQRCPCQPTYWRSSSQIGQRSGLLSANCVPQVSQMANTDMLPASVICCQLRAIIGDMDRHEPRRFRGTEIFGEKMNGTGRLEEGLPGMKIHRRLP